MFQNRVKNILRRIKEKIDVKTSNQNENMKIPEKIPVEIIREVIDVKGNSIKVANDALNNKFYFYSNMDVICFDKGIDWNYNHSNSPNTYLLYLHSLRMIIFLCNAYVESEDKEYLYKAHEILTDWKKFESKRKNKQNKYLWYDHSVAARTITLIYFYSVADGIIKINKTDLVNLLYRHGQFLSEPNHYIENNHGIMMDRALLVLSIFLSESFDSKKWFDLAIERLNSALVRDFSKKYVHLENSPSYHNMTRRIYLGVKKILNEFGIEGNGGFQIELAGMNDYLGYIIKPDNFFPLIGDTTKGKLRGIKKKKGFFIDIEAGITVMQKGDFWLSFIAGYKKVTHKHKDDLSFTLFKGEDIFVDSGPYNYQKNDPIRSYFTSSEAHSTIHIPNKSYTLSNDNKEQEKIRIRRYRSTDEYDFVSGINKKYEGISLIRNIYYLKDDENVILIDRVLSNEDITVEQIFNLAPNVEVRKVDNNYELKTNKNSLIIKQFNKYDIVKLINGDKNIPIAVISEKLGSLIETQQIRYQFSGKSMVFNTLIQLNKIDCTVSIRGNRAYYQTNDKELYLPL